MTDMTTANEIARQIGNRAFTMLGAKNLVGDEKSLTFKIGRNAKRVTHIKVTLTPADLYDVEFIKVGRAPGYKVETLAKTEGAFFDMLHELIETHTGMATSL